MLASLEEITFDGDACRFVDHNDNAITHGALYSVIMMPEEIATYRGGTYALVHKHMRERHNLVLNSGKEYGFYCNNHFDARHFPYIIAVVTEIVGREKRD